MIKKLKRVCELWLQQVFLEGILQSFWDVCINGSVDFVEVQIMNR